MKAEKYFTPEQFAQEVGVPVKRVVRWVHENRLPHVRIGRTILIPRNVLDAMLTRRGGASDPTLAATVSAFIAEGDVA